MREAASPVEVVTLYVSSVHFDTEIGLLSYQPDNFAAGFAVVGESQVTGLSVGVVAAAVVGVVVVAAAAGAAVAVA